LRANMQLFACVCVHLWCGERYSVLFLVGVGVQGLACWNAEFSVEQV